MTGKYVVSGIVIPLAIDLMSLSFFRSIIYRILVGNIRSRKATYNKANKIARKYKLSERIKQTYIVNHITKYIKEYRRYMVFKRIHIVWTITSLIVMFFLPEFLQNQQLQTVVRIREIIAVITFFALSSKFDYKQHTRFDK